MVHQRWKDLLFYGVGLYSLVSYPLFRIKFDKSKDLGLHIGCGKKKIPGLVNIDANPLAKSDLLYDVRVRLPFSNDSVKFIYSGGTLEHFYPDELSNILKEFYRVLQKDGVLRIVVPDLEKSTKAYLEKDYDFFLDFPRSFKSMGGRFTNFLFCDAQHKMAFDFDFMKEILNSLGFQRIHKLSWGNSFLDAETYERIKPSEDEYKDYSLFVEAIK
ncbi:MAG TPA: methyltransferase domain-containing protein [Thermodesulfobacteriota bacterium]|nr:methyltransferase domain-containing protein [Thermodesulfobacteriota bacterium]